MKNTKTGKEYFRRIHDLRPMKLNDLLIYRYQFKPKEAFMLSDFLMKILKWYPSDRPSAQEMLSHPWLSMPDEYSYKMSEIEY
jgi:serine/threonine protein kinase